jgi:hypothetical protein
VAARAPIAKTRTARDLNVGILFLLTRLCEDEVSIGWLGCEASTRKVAEDSVRRPLSLHAATQVVVAGNRTP